MEKRAPLHTLRTLKDMEDWLDDFRTKSVANWEVRWRGVLARDGLVEHYFVQA